MARDGKVHATMFIVEFQKISNGKYFGRSNHPDRPAAERHAVTELMRLGETEENARAAAAVADWGCADASAHGYGVRIFEE